MREAISRVLSLRNQLFRDLAHLQRDDGRDKDAHDVNKGQARADYSVADEFNRQVIDVHINVRGVVVCVRFSFHVRHFNRSID